jgi:DNA-binding transcriptional LysR family regulator
MAEHISRLLPDTHLLAIVAQTRSFTQAARRLGISKASVSMRIRDLERAIGVALVRRTTRSVSLTEAGRQLAEDTQSAFARIEQSLSSVADLAGSERGLVRVTAPVALGRQQLTPMLVPFLQRYPEIRVELDLTDRFVNLVQEGFDLAIRHTQTPPETQVAWVLAGSRSLLVASEEYLRKRGAPAHPSDLATHSCLLYLRDGPAPSWSFEKRSKSRRVEQVSVPVTGPLKANNSEVLREAVLGGLGIGLLPDFSASGPHAKELIPVLPAWSPVGFFGERLYAVRPWSTRVPRAVQCLVEHLRKSFANLGTEHRVRPRGG